METVINYKGGRYNLEGKEITNWIDQVIFDNEKQMIRIIKSSGDSFNLTVEKAEEIGFINFQKLDIFYKPK